METGDLEVRLEAFEGALEPTRRRISAAGAGGNYDGVVAADTIGGDAHADVLDRRRGGEFERHQLARSDAPRPLRSSAMSVYER